MQQGAVTNVLVNSNETIASLETVASNSESAKNIEYESENWIFKTRLDICW